MEGGGVSTLVLIDDRELELLVSSALVSFSGWATKAPAARDARITLSLLHRDTSTDGNHPARLPVIITPPSTTRFQLSTTDHAASSSSNPLMPLVHTDRPLDFTVTFIRPSAAESDFAWDDFQDQIVVHYKLGRLVVSLNATKQATGGGDTSFHPRSLPSVRAPALKLFDYVERTNAARPLSTEAGTAAYHRSEMRVSESFNGARRTPTQALDPLPPIPTPGSRPGSRDQDRSGRRAVTPSQPPPSQTEKAASMDPIRGSTGVSSLYEARAIIAQLRAQHLACHRSGAAASLSTSVATGSVHVDDDEASPEAHNETARRELDAFNSVVATAKQRVASETAAAKSELSYYEQFLPKAPVFKPDTPPLAATLGPLGSSSSASLTSSEDKSKPKMLRATKRRATGMLPSLGTDSVAVPPVAKTDNNQELSPRKSGSEAVQRAVKKEATPPERRRTPPTTRQLPGLQPQRAHQSNKTSAGASTGQASGRLSVRALSAAKKTTGAQAKAPTATRPQQAEDPLSDFDDADPEIDAAPDLPEEVTGMAALESDCDDGF